MFCGASSGSLLRDQVKAVGIHHLDPGGNKVIHELFFVVILSIDLGVRSKNRVRSK